MKFKVLKNTIYMLKYFFKSSPIGTSLYIFAEICRLFYYVIFIIIFTEIIFNNIERGIQYVDFIYLLVVYLIGAFVIYLFLAIQENCIMPIMYCKTRNYIAENLYTKSTSYDLKCLEDESFYNKFTIVASETLNKASETLDLTCDLLGKLMSITLLLSFIIRDNYIIYLAIITPVVVVHFINKKINQLNHNKYHREVPINRKLGYINRVFHLKEFSQEIKMTNISLLLLDKFSGLKDELLTSIKFFGLKLGILYGVWNVSFNTLPIIAVYLTGIYLFAVAETLSIGAFVSFSIAAAVIQSYLSGLVQLYASFSNNSLYINDIRNFNSYVPEICDSPESIVLCCKNPAIKLSNVSFKYPNANKYVLENITLTINFGEKVALIGLNGAGKSSLVKLLLRLHDPIAGDIQIDNVNIKNYSVTSYRKIYSIMFQEYNIYAMNASDNVSLGKEISEEIISDSLSRASIKEKTDSFSYSTVLSKEFDNTGEILSGGESQKISLARFFAQQSMIAIVDEPTSALDPFAAKNVFDEIIECTSKKTLIYITHTLSHVVNFDKIYVLDGGEIKEQGTHYDLLEQNGLYANMYKAQSENFKTKAGE